MPSFYLLLYHLVLSLHVALENPHWCSFLTVIGNSCRVSWRRVSWTRLGVYFGALFGASKLKWIKNDENDCVKKKDAPNKVTVISLCKPRWHNHCKISFYRITLLFGNIQDLLTQLVLLKSNCNNFKAWYYCII